MNNTAQQQPTGEGRFDAKFWQLESYKHPGQQFYYCSPAFIAADGTAIVGDDFLMAGSEERVLDQKLISHNIFGTIRLVANFLHECKLKGEEAKVVVPLNATAVSVETVAVDFADTCREYFADISDQIIFEMVNFPDKFTIDYLDHIGILVFPFCQEYIARPSPAWTNFTIFANCNFQGVSFDLKNKPWPSDKIRPHLEKFCQSASLNRLTPYLMGAASPDIQGLANELGFKFVAGKAID
tara:strand:+ start:13933 stop:14652 length:720 start_codon:yes stop_codon:yes gene_type:complete